MKENICLVTYWKNIKRRRMELQVIKEKDGITSKKKKNGITSNKGEGGNNK